jgi:hypothetical protein
VDDAADEIDIPFDLLISEAEHAKLMPLNDDASLMVGLDLIVVN